MSNNKEKVGKNNYFGYFNVKFGYAERDVLIKDCYYKFRLEDDRVIWVDINNMAEVYKAQLKWKDCYVISCRISHDKIVPNEGFSFVIIRRLGKIKDTQ